MVIPELKQIEQKIIADRYREHLANALAEACNKLTPDERLLLLMRYEADFSLREIAKLLETHCSGAVRQLRKVQGKLRDYIICGLSTEPDMNGRTIAECLRDMVENPYHEISILDCIKESMVQRKPPAAAREWVKRSALTLVKTATFKSNCAISARIADSE
ncbi:MAG TPA: sigma factor-like helix-turn-helix DNA-binding protein [Candidatus Angelobacter sp.]